MGTFNNSDSITLNCDGTFEGDVMLVCLIKSGGGKNLIVCSNNCKCSTGSSDKDDKRLKMIEDINTIGTEFSACVFRSDVNGSEGI